VHRLLFRLQRNPGPLGDKKVRERGARTHPEASPTYRSSDQAAALNQEARAEAVKAVGVPGWLLEETKVSYDVRRRGFRSSDTRRELSHDEELAAEARYHRERLQTLSGKSPWLAAHGCDPSTGTRAA
jgi:hypothetical protein